MRAYADAAQAFERELRIQILERVNPRELLAPLQDFALLAYDLSFPAGHKTQASRSEYEHSHDLQELRAAHASAYQAHLTIDVAVHDPRAPPLFAPVPGNPVSEQRLDGAYLLYTDGIFKLARQTLMEAIIYVAMHTGQQHDHGGEGLADIVVVCTHAKRLHTSIRVIQGLFCAIITRMDEAAEYEIGPRLEGIARNILPYCSLSAKNNRANTY